MQQHDGRGIDVDASTRGAFGLGRLGSADEEKAAKDRVGLQRESGVEQG
jgi:hypothetical protein